ncbi:bifunctional aspartokinase/homoserine dehydrogenase I [Tanacetum coccineum]
MAKAHPAIRVIIGFDTTTEDDKCFGIDDLDNTINVKAQELLANEEPDSFLSRGLEKSIDQSDLEYCESAISNENDGSDSENLIRRIDSANTPYPVTQGTTKRDDVKSKHLYSASAYKIDEKKPEMKNLPQHLEYAYLYGGKSFPIIISSELSKKEKISLLQVLDKLKGEIAWNMSDIKGISPSYYTHKILMEDDYKPVIQPQRCLNPKAQHVVKKEIVKLLDSGLIYPISDSLWVSPIHVVPKKGGMPVVLNDNNELILSRTVAGWRIVYVEMNTTVFLMDSQDSSKYLSLWRIKKRLPSPVLMGLSLTDEYRLDYVMLLQLFKDAWRKSSTTWWKSLWKFLWKTSRYLVELEYVGIRGATLNIPTTLKRDGSDFSAAIMGALFRARQVTIWTDVDGVYSADPRKVSDAVVLNTLSYQEAWEMSYFGANVLHPRTIVPVMQYDIPIVIRNIFNLSAPGTKICRTPFTESEENQKLESYVKGFATIYNLALVNVEGTVMGGVPGTASDIFAAVKDVGANVIMISQGIDLSNGKSFRRKEKKLIWKKEILMGRGTRIVLTAVLTSPLTRASVWRGVRVGVRIKVRVLELGSETQDLSTGDKIIKIEGIFRECGLNLELSDIPVESLVPGIESCDKDIQGSQDHSGRIDEERNGESMLLVSLDKEDTRVDVILDFLKRNDFARADEALSIEMGGVSIRERHSLRKKEICIPEDVEHESNADEDEDGQPLNSHLSSQSSSGSGSTITPRNSPGTQVKFAEYGGEPSHDNDGLPESGESHVEDVAIETERLLMCCKWKVVDLTPCVDVGKFIKEVCLEFSGIVIDTRTLLAKDPQCLAEYNERYISMMEKYFDMSDELKLLQARPDMNDRGQGVAEMETIRFCLSKNASTNDNKHGASLFIRYRAVVHVLLSADFAIS